MTTVKVLSIFLSSLSSIAIILTIIFEGKLKLKPKEIKEKVSFLEVFNSERKKLSPFGVILISIGLFTNLGNGYLVIQNINDSSKQYTEDTIRFRSLLTTSYQVNSELRIKSHNDSIMILNLLGLSRANLSKSDSIRISVVDNAVKELEEQRSIRDKNYQNIFINFKSEIRENLRKILLMFDKKIILAYDSVTFTSTRLKNDQIKKYITISQNSLIIDYLSKTSSHIDVANQYADIIAGEMMEKKNRDVYVRQFLSKVEASEIRLIQIFQRIDNIHNFKDYENFDFKIKPKKMNEDSLIYYFQIETLLNEHKGFKLIEDSLVFEKPDE